MNLHLVFVKLLIFLSLFHIELVRSQEEQQVNRQQCSQNDENQDSDFSSWETCWKKLHTCQEICVDPTTFSNCLPCIKDALEDYPFVTKILDGILIVIGAFFVRIQYVIWRNCRSSRKKNSNNDQSTRQMKPVKNNSESYHQTHNQNITYNIQNNYYYCVNENGQTKQLSEKKFTQLVGTSNDDNYNNNQLLIEEE